MKLIALAILLSFLSAINPEKVTNNWIKKTFIDFNFNCEVSNIIVVQSKRTNDTFDTGLIYEISQTLTIFEVYVKKSGFPKKPIHFIKNKGKKYVFTNNWLKEYLTTPSWERMEKLRKYLFPKQEEHFQMQKMQVQRKK